MKRIFSRLAIAAVLLTAPAYGQAQANAPGAGATAALLPRLQSPDISEDHLVTFRVRAPKASEVLFEGDWNGVVNLPMTNLLYSRRVISRAIFLFFFGRKTVLDDAKISESLRLGSKAFR